MQQNANRTYIVLDSLNGALDDSQMYSKVSGHWSQTCPDRTAVSASRLCVQSLLSAGWTPIGLRHSLEGAAF